MFRKVYLATDYPLEGLQGGSGDAHSGTLNKMLTAEHHVAMRGFLEEFEREFGEGEERMELTGFGKEQGRVRLSREMREAFGGGKRKVDFQELDGAIVGIVDKIVLMKAEGSSSPSSSSLAELNPLPSFAVFIAGASSSSSSTEGKCGKNSQFTEQVIAGRKAVWSEQKEGEPVVGRLWNEAGHFAMKREDED